MKKSVKASLVSATLAASLLLSAAGSVFAFTDVDSNHWAANDIAKLSNAGYINGYEDGSFAPSAFITRAEFVTIINKVKGAAVRSYKTYPDVSSDAWYADQIDIAATAGFITGYDDGSIRPDACISRAEVAVVCYKAWNLSPEGQLSFTDSSSIGSWAQTQIATLVAKNVLSGYEDGSFRPGEPITRAEVAKIVSRMMDMTTTAAQTTNSTVVNPVIPGSAGLSNTGVVIRGGGSSGGSSGGGSSRPQTTATPNPDATATPAPTAPAYVTTAITNLSSSKDYSKANMDQILGYSKNTKVKATESNAVIYKSAVPNLLDNYKNADFKTEADAKDFANDLSAVINVTDAIVDGFTAACKNGTATTKTLTSLSAGMTVTINNYAANSSQVRSVIDKLCAELNKNVEKYTDEELKNVKEADAMAVLQGKYVANAKEVTSEVKVEVDNVLADAVNIDKGSTNSTITKDELNTIISLVPDKKADGTDAETAEVDDAIAETTIYQDAIVALIVSDETDYSTNTNSEAAILAKDVNAVIDATNEAVKKVEDLAKAGNLNKDSLISYKADLDKIIDGSDAVNNEEIKTIMTEQSLELYNALQGSFDTLNDKGSAVTTQDILDLYNNYKKGTL